MRRKTYLIRHGEAVINRRPDLLSGRSNSAPLTARGEAEARELGHLLRERGLIPTIAYTSPAVRARRTAEVALAEMGLVIALNVADALQELDQGEWEGAPRSATFDEPSIKARIKADGLDFKAPGGESMRETGARVLDWLSSPAATQDPNQKDDNIVFAFSHIMAIRSAAALASGWSRPQAYEVAIPNTSLSLLEFHNDILQIVYLGRMAHELD